MVNFCVDLPSIDILKSQINECCLTIAIRLQIFLRVQLQPSIHTFSYLTSMFLSDLFAQPGWSSSIHDGSCLRSFPCHYLPKQRRFAGRPRSCIRQYIHISISIQQQRQSQQFTRLQHLYEPASLSVQSFGGIVGSHCRTPDQAQDDQPPTTLILSISSTNPISASTCLPAQITVYNLVTTSSKCTRRGCAMRAVERSGFVDGRTSPTLLSNC